MTKPALKRLSPMDLYQSPHSWESQSLWTYGPHKLRVLIDRDAFDFQSTIHAQIWNPDKFAWNAIADLPFALAPAALKAVSYVDRPGKEDRERQAAFEEAEGLVLKSAILILSP